MERRLTTRHRARTTVYVLLPGHRRRLCRARNLSATGVFVETGDMGLRKGQTVELAFAISLGTITKTASPHRGRRARFARRHRPDDAEPRHLIRVPPLRRQFPLRKGYCGFGDASPTVM